MKPKILSPETRDTLTTFATRLAAIFAKAEPARFFTSRGQLVYTKINCDPEQEVKDLLEDFLED